MKPRVSSGNEFELEIRAKSYAYLVNRRASIAFCPDREPIRMALRGKWSLECAYDSELTVE